MENVSFILSGSNGQTEVSSSLLPVYEGDYYSLGMGNIYNKNNENIYLFHNMLEQDASIDENLKRIFAVVVDCYKLFQCSHFT